MCVRLIQVNNLMHLRTNQEICLRFLLFFFLFFIFSLNFVFLSSLVDRVDKKSFLLWLFLSPIIIIITKVLSFIYCIKCRIISAFVRPNAQVESLHVGNHEKSDIHETSLGNNPVPFLNFLCRIPCYSCSQFISG